MIAIVPFLTIAQKRSKKNTKTEKISTSNATYEFMVIIGSELEKNNPKNKEDKLAPNRLGGVSSKIAFNFDFGSRPDKEVTTAFMKSSGRFRSMVDAVSFAATLGWQFHSANVVDSKGSKVHYYYMKKDK